MTNRRLSIEYEHRDAEHEHDLRKPGARMPTADWDAGFPLAIPIE